MTASPSTTPEVQGQTAPAAGTTPAAPRKTTRKPASKPAARKPAAKTVKPAAKPASEVSTARKQELAALMIAAIARDPKVKRLSPAERQFCASQVSYFPGVRQGKVALPDTLGKVNMAGLSKPNGNGNGNGSKTAKPAPRKSTARKTSK